MKIIESGIDEEYIFVRLDKSDDSVAIEIDDTIVWLTPLETQQLADALQRSCNKTQYFQGLRNKCT